jgi:hypothetical protein
MVSLTVAEMLGRAPTPPRFAAMLDPSLEALLMDAAPDPGEFASVRGLLEGCLRALWDMARLDDALFERLSGGEQQVLDLEDPTPVLLHLAAVTLDGVRELLHGLDALGFVPPEDVGAALEELDFDVSAPRAPQDSLGLDELDIDGALSGLHAAPDPVRQRQAGLRKLVGSLRYGMQSQIAGFERRFDAALEGGHMAQAMEDLDDTRNAVGEGVFALVTALCEAYLPDIRAESVVPGHKSALDKALLVRRGLADLTRSVDHENWRIQDQDDVEQGAAALDRLREQVHGYMRGEAFRAMRPADRWELLKVTRLLEGATLGTRTRQTCEGLAKYLEGLSSINQREVLRRHDVAVLKDVRENLEAARPLLGISPFGAQQLLAAAVTQVGGLYGKSRELDALLIKWRLTPPDLQHPGEVEEVLRELSQVLSAQGM